MWPQYVYYLIKWLSHRLDEINIIQSRLELRLGCFNRIIGWLTIILRDLNWKLEDIVRYKIGWDC